MGIYHYTVDLSWNGAGSPGVNVWDIRQQALDPTSELALAVDAIDAFYASVVSSGLIYPDGYRATGRNEAIEVNSSQIEAVPGFVHNQSGAGSDFSGLNQMIATIRTSSATRRGRGRKYIGPVAAETLDSDGTPTTGALSALQTACTNLVTASTANNGWAVGVYSSVDGLFRDMVQMTARNYFASMRSRRD